MHTEETDGVVDHSEQVQDSADDFDGIGRGLLARQKYEKRHQKLLAFYLLSSLVLHAAALFVYGEIPQHSPPTPQDPEELISFELVEIEPESVSEPPPSEPVPEPPPPEPVSEPPPPEPVPEPPPPEPPPPEPVPEPPPSEPVPEPPPPEPPPEPVPEPIPEPTAAPEPVVEATPQPQFTPLIEAVPSEAEPPAPVAPPSSPPAPPPEPPPTPVAALPPVEPDVLARPLRSALVSPDYPSEARRQGREGVVLVRAKVTADGNVSEVLIAQSSGYDPFDEAALDAVRQWRFEPARLGENPVESWVVQPIRFNLN